MAADERGLELNEQWMDSVRRTALRRTAVLGLPVAAATALTQLFLHHLPVPAAVIAVGGVLWGSTYLLLRRGVRVVSAFHYLAVIGTSTVVVTSYLRGGYLLAFAQYLLLFPLAAVMLRLRREALVWAAIGTCTTVGLLAVTELGLAPELIPVPAYLAALSNVGLMIVLSGVAHGAVLMLEERARLAARDERTLGRRRRLESLGRLAGGVAHDFNNLLAVVRSSAESLLGSVEDAEQTESCQAILDSAGQGASLTRSLLAFTRDDERGAEICDVSAVVKRTAALVRRVVPANVEIAVHAPRPFVAEVSADALGRALLNLCLNARDAMPDGGRLAISCESLHVAEVAEAPRTQHGALAPGRWVVIRVQDDGEGIDERIMDQVFEPFFTTKPKQRGTGLGLSGVLGTLRDARGAVGLDSETGEGTEFRLYLPRAKGSALTPPPGALMRTRAVVGVRVLFVEDDAAVRRSIGRLLRNAGLDITGVDSGVEALRAIEEAVTPYDVMLTDFEMPGMSGVQLMAAARDQGFEGRVVLLTGYIGGELHAPDTIILRKPCARDELLEALEPPANLGA